MPETLHQQQFFCRANVWNILVLTGCQRVGIKWTELSLIKLNQNPTVSRCQDGERECYRAVRAAWQPTNDDRRCTDRSESAGHNSPSELSADINLTQTNTQVIIILSIGHNEPDVYILVKSQIGVTIRLLFLAQSGNFRLSNVTVKSFPSLMGP